MCLPGCHPTIQSVYLCLELLFTPSYGLRTFSRTQSSLKSTTDKTMTIFDTSNPILPDTSNPILQRSAIFQFSKVTKTVYKKKFEKLQYVDQMTQNVIALLNI